MKATTPATRNGAAADIGAAAWIAQRERRDLKCGKVTVLLQPDRGSGYRATTIGLTPHATTMSPFYLWLRDIEKIDALVHLGTHGTLEWLPGKALALSAECWPERGAGRAAGDLSLHRQQSRRGGAGQAPARRAVTIGHLTPPLSAAGLAWPARRARRAGRRICRRRRPRSAPPALSRRARSSSAPGRAGWRPNAAWCAARPTTRRIAKLDALAVRHQGLSIGDGLHVFGRAPDETFQACAVGERARAAGARSTAGACRPGRPARPRAGAPDVLPTGRNLTSVDPARRADPHRLGDRRPRRRRDLRRYLQDHGDWPRALVLDLWGSATMRTGGDDLAQALAYLGVRPVWDNASSRVTGFEVMPLAMLDRPRIDVTLRISGLFRDVFPSQIALFDLAVRARRRARRGRRGQSARRRAAAPAPTWPACSAPRPAATAPRPATSRSTAPGRRATISARPISLP